MHKLHMFRFRNTFTFFSHMHFRVNVKELITVYRWLAFLSVPTDNCVVFMNGKLILSIKLHAGGAHLQNSNIHYSMY
jgi:hypothetical protein